MTNNYLTHAQWTQLADKLKACKTTAECDQVRKAFAALSAKQDAELREACQDIGSAACRSQLADVQAGTLKQKELAQAGVRCSESAKNSYGMFKSYAGYKYEPVRFIVTDITWFTAESMRPLEEYDALDGEPFWVR